MCTIFVFTLKIRSKTDANVEPVEELLGSLTTYNGIQRGESPGQTVRTSARVFKKMRQDSSQTQPTTSSVSTVLDTSEKDKKGYCPHYYFVFLVHKKYSCCK